MVRKGVGILGLLIAIGLAGEPAAAGSRKSSSQMESRALLVAPAAQSDLDPIRAAGLFVVGGTFRDRLFRLGRAQRERAR